MSQITNASYDHPFSYVDIVSHIAQFTGLAGLIPSTLVCKAWHDIMQNPSIWFTLFDTESIPRIEGHEVASAKEDFQFMYPRTHSAKQMAPLGRFVGIVPQLDPVVFENFRTIMDPYDPTKKMSETWVFVVEPESIYRDDVDDKLLEALKTKGDFEANATDDELKKRGVLIPYSLKNLKVFAHHPVTNKGTRVFGFFGSEVLSACSRTSKVVRVTLMRKEVPESTRKKTWAQQKVELAENEHVPVKLSTRAYYDATNILNKGTCPDKKEGHLYTYSRTGDEIKVGTDPVILAIGAFAPGTGVNVYYYYSHAYDISGTAPAVPAEVQHSSSEPMELEN